MTLPDQSTIKPLGREPRPATFIVADPTPEGYIPVWIDGRNGEPFANVRLTPDDAKRLMTDLAGALEISR